MVHVRHAACLFVISLFATPLLAGDVPTAEDLLDASIKYHDPDGDWLRGTFMMTFEGERPDGGTRVQEVLLAEQGGRFEQTAERGGHQVTTMVANDACTFKVDGKEPSAEEIEELKLSCDGAKRYRNYLAYLWGLPMKLHDPGTHLDPKVERTTFEGKETLRLHVTYDPEVGSEIWNFFFDPETYALVGYSFYKDEAETHGEIIVLSEEHVDGSLRLPRARAWYQVPGKEYLGTDRLVGLERR